MNSVAFEPKRPSKYGVFLLKKKYIGTFGNPDIPSNLY